MSRHHHLAVLSALCAVSSFGSVGCGLHSNQPFWSAVPGFCPTVSRLESQLKVTLFLT